jgi:hypothetical protein
VKSCSVICRKWNFIKPRARPPKAKAIRSNRVECAISQCALDPTCRRFPDPSRQVISAPGSKHCHGGLLALTLLRRPQPAGIAKGDRHGECRALICFQSYLLSEHYIAGDQVADRKKASADNRAAFLVKFFDIRRNASLTKNSIEALEEIVERSRQTWPSGLGSSNRRYIPPSSGRNKTANHSPRRYRFIFLHRCNSRKCRKVIGGQKTSWKAGRRCFRATFLPRRFRALIPSRRRSAIVRRLVHICGLSSRLRDPQASGRRVHTG